MEVTTSRTDYAGTCCVETDWNKFIGSVGDDSLCEIPQEAEYRLVHGLTIHIRLYLA